LPREPGKPDNLEGLERLSTLLSEPGALEALEKLVKVAVKMNESGLLDFMEALADGRIIREALEALLSSGGLELLDKFNALVKELGEAADVLVEEPRPLGLTGILESLKDPDVRRGVGRLLLALKVLGRLRLGEALEDLGGAKASPRPAESPT
jgi:uncharacterized protein YjgD (DUF1641 family)